MKDEEGLQNIKVSQERYVPRKKNLQCNKMTVTSHLSRTLVEPVTQPPLQSVYTKTCRRSITSPRLHQRTYVPVVAPNTVREPPEFTYLVRNKNTVRYVFRRNTHDVYPSLPSYGGTRSPNVSFFRSS